VASFVDWQKTYTSDDEKMALAIELSKQNVERGTGGPFGTAIFDRSSGQLLGVGVNRVVPLTNSTLHGETVAIMMAEKALGTFTLAADSGRELFTSCEPCAMCMGAVLWSGVNRMVCAGAAEDARAIGFDEGPVFEQSYQYLENAGMEVVRQFKRNDAKAVLDYYKNSGGRIYNGRD
jgi:tRNA(Arg) A34 adenosine deaminase TadA